MSAETRESAGTPSKTQPQEVWAGREMRWLLKERKEKKKKRKKEIKKGKREESIIRYQTDLRRKLTQTVNALLHFSLKSKKRKMKKKRKNELDSLR